MTLRRILIANRGEIAVRIIRTCHRLGIEAVLGASAADLDSVPARLADAVICLGPAEPAASYLDAVAVAAAARAARADAVHPGYGFLAESPRLARACAAAGITFIGPSADVLAAAGDKLAAREHALAAGLPVLPGGEVHDPAQAGRLAAEIGWPLLVKAAGGGGGRGIRLVSQPGELGDAVHRAMAEAGAAFGDTRVYLERFVTRGRHVEVQLLGDGDTMLRLGDRDCSVQRRYQKLAEEAPAPALGEGLRAGLDQAAAALGKQLRYHGAGTAEFLVDCDRGAFYFLELNARIQVEHPVTEAVCGVDLVAEQIALAEGRPLRPGHSAAHPAAHSAAHPAAHPAAVPVRGHALECRINAEDWANGFRPGPGVIREAVFPVGEGVRVDTHVQPGTRVPPYYDALLAKVIVHGRDRAEAVRRLRGALARCRITGVPTNLGLHAALAADAEFAAGGVDTAWAGRFLRRVAGDG
jgi:acetyl-CoA carboxylase biotin carboxylase subunit